MAEESKSSLWGWCCATRSAVTVMRPTANAPSWSQDGQWLVPQGEGGAVAPVAGLASPSQYLKPAPTVIENHTTDQLVGVGIVFESTRTGQTGLVVASLLSEGSAMRSGLIEPGDELVGVDGRDVRNLDPQQLAPLILGKQGSQVQMEFRERGPRQQKLVTMTRSYIMRR